jgi:hypothetical protein
MLSFEGGSSRSHYVEELFWEEALDLSSDRILNEWSSKSPKNLTTRGIKFPINQSALEICKINSCFTFYDRKI